MSNAKKPKIIRVATIPAALYKLLRGQLKYLSKNFDILGVCSPGNYIANLEEEENINVNPIEIRREISIVRDLISLFKLIHLFKKERPLIVHSHTPKAGLLSMLAAKITGVPIRIHTFTGMRFETTKGSLRKLLISLDKLTCKCATEIIPEGEGVKKVLIKNNITKKELKIIHNGNINGVNPEYFNPALYSEEDKKNFRSELGIEKEDFVVSFIGRIVGDKGINELLEAFNALSKSYSNLKLILVGPLTGNADPISEKSKEILDKNSNIITTGLQQEIRPYLLISDVFVLPSYREGFPNVVLQAESMGIPCIVTDINGSNEIIIDRYNGLIIPPKNKDAIKFAILELYKNPDLQKFLASNAIKNVITKYYCEDVWKATEKRYLELIDNYEHK